MAETLPFRSNIALFCFFFPFERRAAKNGAEGSRHAAAAAPHTCLYEVYYYACGGKQSDNCHDDEYDAGLLYGIVCFHNGHLFLDFLFRALAPFDVLSIPHLRVAVVCLTLRSITIL